MSTERKYIKINTTRFGIVLADEDTVIEFPEGLLGFETEKSFALMAGEISDALWLQSTTTPSLAFVVTDPNLHFPDYLPPINSEQLLELGIENIEDAQLFVILNVGEGVLTANLIGPLVMNIKAKTARQFVLVDDRWSVKHEIGVSRR